MSHHKSLLDPCHFLQMFSIGRSNPSIHYEFVAEICKKGSNRGASSYYNPQQINCYDCV